MESYRQDQALVKECLQGNEAAWSTLIDKYKNLIFSIPIKRGFSPDDAADIFQSVCLTLVSDLPRLREPRALAAWLMQTTSHRCFRWERLGRQYLGTDLEDEKLAERLPKMPDEVVRELEREQMVREAVAELPSECKRVVELLFYQVPAATYEDTATALQIPKGSIGPTRMRCLAKLKKLLEKKGF